MASESVNAWDAAVLIVSESTFGTVPNPATAQSFEAITTDMGQMEVGDVRGKKDRSSGRGMQGAFVEGRVKPIPFNIEASVKSRSAADTTPQESALYRAAGLTQTVTGATSVAYTLPATPIQTSNSFAGLSMYRALGKGSYIYEAEQLRGGVVKTLDWSGGDKELMIKASGEAIGKYELGYSASVTLADNSGTTLTFANAEEAYRFGFGWYLIESEVVKITARPTTTTATIARAQLSTSAAAHAAQPMIPYLPTLTYAGSPVSEGGTVTVTLDGVTLRAMSFGITLTSGMDLLPGESGSKYVQAPKAVRYDLKANVKLVLAREQVSLLGKARDRNTCAVTIVQSTGTAGGINTFSMPYTEVMPFKVPDTANDVAIVDVALRVRDNSGNDAFSYVMT